MHPGRRLVRPLAFTLAAFAAAAAAAAQSFPPITEQERALTRVEKYPNAPAVVLFKRARFGVVDPVSGVHLRSFMVVVRRKILTAEGSQRFGEVVVHRSSWMRLLWLEARTVLPDGRVVPVPKDATFERRTARANDKFETTIAFPAVTVGAILDYRYEVLLMGGWFLGPWSFQEEVPTLHSEIAYELPFPLMVTTWAPDPLHAGIRQTEKRVAEGNRVEAWGDDLAPLPDEPYSVPPADLASRFLLLPLGFLTPGGDEPLFKDWPSTCKLWADDYDRARRKARDAVRKGKEIAQAVPGGGRRDKAVALYRFVRDEIATEDSPDVSSAISLPEGSTGDSVLAARRGTSAEKALLLATLLAAAGIDAHPVWAADRDEGLINLQLANPLWFDRVLVAVDLDGQRLFLDPADRRLGFGHLAPSFEGMPALLYDAKRPQRVEIPLSPAAESARLARLDLELAADGRMSGKGTLVLTGHRAWERLHAGEDAEKAAKAWKEWLVKAFRGYEVSAVHVDEQVEEERVDVSWTMAERAEEVLGDEASLLPSRPLGPARQPFTLPAAERVSPVLFRFASHDEVEMTLRWPAGWTVETPVETRYQNAVGALFTRVKVDEAARSLTYHRSFALVQREIAKTAYPAVQALFAVAERSDAKRLSLVRR